MNSTIIFFSILILILSSMLMFKIKIYLDVLNDLIIIDIYLFNFKLYNIRISIVGFNYEINNNKKIKPLKLILTNEEKFLIKQIKSSILDKLYYDNIYLKTKFGFSNAYFDFKINSFLNILCNYYCYKNSFSDTKFIYFNDIDFINNNIKIELELKVYFTLFDLAFAILMSFYKRGKYVKQRK